MRNLFDDGLNQMWFNAQKKQFPETNVERFYRWMKEIDNVHLDDKVRMARAFHIVATH